jgi:hypothetical protein
MVVNWSAVMMYINDKYAFTLLVCIDELLDCNEKMLGRRRSTVFEKKIVNND